MDDARAHLEKYKVWILGVDCSSRRRESAERLLQAVECRNYDLGTLEELTKLLDYEKLCVNLCQDLGSKKSSIHPGPSELDIALQIPFITSVVDALSQCLVRAISQTAYVERELQCKGLLAAIALLHAHGIEELQHEWFGEILGSRLPARFRDLRWAAVSSEELTIRQLLKINISFLLSATFEYLTYFREAQPAPAIFASRTISLLSFGLTVSSPAFSGGVFNIQKALEQLSEGSKPFLLEPKALYKKYFALQELSRICGSLRLYQDVVQGITEYETLELELQSRFRQCSSLAFGFALRILEQHPGYENTFTPPHDFWGNFQALCSRGPPRFNKFYFMYGVVDCVNQLCRIASADDIPNRLISIMERVALKAKEPLHRAKALEVLISANPNDPLDLENGIRESSRLALSTRLTREIRRTSQVNPNTQPRSPSIEELDCTPRRSASNNSRTEDEFPRVTADGECTNQRFKSLSSLGIFRRRFVAVGFSPNCSKLYTLEQKEASLYSVSESQILGPISVHKMSSTPLAAALSDRMLAILSYRQLEVMDHSQHALTRTDFDQGWVPSHIAINDAIGSTWIAVAGCRGQTGFWRGSIKMFQVRTSSSGMKIREEEGTFEDSELSNPINGDMIKFVDFSHDGRYLILVTHPTNRILSWRLSSDMKPQGNPFQISRTYTAEPRVQGITTASLFRAPISGRPYVLGTTWPSASRRKNGGEWSFIAAAEEQPSSKLQQSHGIYNITGLQKADPIVAGTASPDGRVIALLENTGRVNLFPLKACAQGGLETCDKIRLEQQNGLADQDTASPSSVRFRAHEDTLELFVADNTGNFLYKKFHQYHSM